MATYATLTVPVLDIIGAEFNASRASVWIEPNVPVVLADSVRVGGRREQLVNGVATFANLVTTDSADNPASFGYRVTITAPPKGAAGRRDIVNLTTADFPFTATANLKDIDEAWDNIVIPAVWRSDFRDEMEAAAEAAAASATSAAASASAAATITGIDSTDSAVAALVETPAGPLTQAALSATIATGIEESDYLPATFAPGRSGKSAGATGDGTTDDTTALQTALDEGGTVYLTAGDYRINVTAAAGSDGSNVGLRMTVPGTTLVMHDDAKLRALPSSSERYAVIEITAPDCAVVGGQIVGDIGSHVGATGEWGHGIAVLEAAHRTRIENVRISKCWGDGICVGDSGVAYATGARPADVRITNVICDDNRRQGISVVSALRLQINGGAFINTGQSAYTAPGAGIGIEANTGGLQAITDLTIAGATCSRNKGRGAYFNSAGNELTATVTGVRAVDNDQEGFACDYAAEVTFTGCEAVENGVTAAVQMDGFYVSPTTTKPVTFIGCVAVGNTQSGFFARADDVSFTSCRARGNGYAGFVTEADRTAFTACHANGNNQASNFYGQFMLDGSAADPHLVACISEAGQGATKAGWGYQVGPSVTGAQFSGCTAKGSFTAGAFLDSGTGTIALPKPGVAKQTGVAVTAAGIHAALVNLGLITA